MSGLQQFESLRRRSPVVLPSLLLCDFADLGGELRRLEAAGVEAFHLDVMDGQFVPNLTYGMPIVEACRSVTKRPLDVHLMIAEPERYVEAFVRAGADIVTIHLETVPDAVRARRALEQIRALGAAAGLALNPATPLDAGAGLWGLCDLILVMSVPAGFGGQEFDESALVKLRRLRESLAPEAVLEVDGGINGRTIGRCAEAGADWFVVGSAIFKEESYEDAVGDLNRLARSSKPGS